MHMPQHVGPMHMPHARARGLDVGHASLTMLLGRETGKPDAS